MRFLVLGVQMTQEVRLSSLPFFCWYRSSIRAPLLRDYFRHQSRLPEAWSTPRATSQPAQSANTKPRDVGAAITAC